MTKKNKEEQWVEANMFQLNRILINLVGYGLGYIPLANLIDIKGVENQTLAEILTEEGLKAKLVGKDLLVYIK